MTSLTETSGIKINENEILEYARDYLKDGLTIIPLDGKTLQPLISSWGKYAYPETCATLEEVEQWVRQWPDLKWGLPTGRGIGFIVVHVKTDGDESRWPATICYEAADEGINLIYAHPGNYRPSSVKVKSIEDFLPLTDVIGDDSYIALPSSTREGGWIADVHDIDVAKVPDDILPLILNDPDYVMTSVPDGVQLPESERFDITKKYLSELLANIPLGDKRLVESLWPKVKLWNATISKRPYRNEEELRGVFDLFSDPAYSPLGMTDSTYRPILRKASEETSQVTVDQAEIGSVGGKAPSQSTRLVNMVLENKEVTLFRDEYGVAYAQFLVVDHKEVWPCKSSSFTRWLGAEYYRLMKGRTVAGRESIKDAISLLEGRAINECPENRLYNRVAQTPDTIWYDLGDDKWRAVRITKEGWSVVTDVPLLFRRFSHLAPQVVPTRGGSVKDVLPFVNVTDPELQILFLVHLVTLFIPGWPHPALYVYGTQGSAKSTLLRIDRKLIDPSKIEVVGLTRHEKELEQQLGHHAFLALDNVSDMPDWIADILCRAITGSGFSKRELYSDDSDVIRHVMANVGINGINVASNRGDLLERSLLLKLERMSKESRKQEHELMSDFELARPKILGAIFDTVAKAMDLKPSMEKIKELPRMADFATWGGTIAEVLGIGQDAFHKAYFRNINSQSEELINDNTVATILKGLVEAHSGEWASNPTELFKAFRDQALVEHIIDNRLPANPAALMREINRLKTPFEETGYHILSGGHDRAVTIWRDPIEPPATDGAVGSQKTQ